MSTSKIHATCGNCGQKSEWIEVGPEKDELSLRDQFAIAALEGFIASLTEREWQHFGQPEHVAKTAYQMADAMLAERQKEIK